MAIVYIVYEICRLVFLAVNWSMFSDSLTWHAFGEMLVGGWFFDTSAILYTNALYALLMLFPIHYKESALYQKVAKWVFVVVNAVSIVANLTDCVYFQYTTRRTTGTVFSEFKNENNLGSIFGVELLRHWYLVLIGVLPEYRSKGANALIFADLIEQYRRYGFKWAEAMPQMESNKGVQSQWQYLESVQHRRRRCYRRKL